MRVVPPCLRRIALLAALASCGSTVSREFHPAPVPDAAPRDPAGDVSGPEVAVQGEHRTDRSATRLVGGSFWIGGEVVDAEDEPLGTVLDVLLEPVTGRIVGLSVATEEDERLVVDHDSLDAERTDTRDGRIVLACTESELPGRGADRERFAHAERVRVSGEVTQLETRRGGAGEALFVRLRDEKNLLHRVLVQPAFLLAASTAGLRVGVEASAEGVLTRDETAKLLVANRVEWGGSELRLRDDSGAVAWSELAVPFRSGAALARRTIEFADGSESTSDGWWFDRERGAIEFLRVEVDGELRAVPWSRLTWRPEGDSWSTDLRPDELESFAAEMEAPRS